MITDDKIKEIQKSLRSGIPEGELKNELISQGYTENEIAKIFAPRKYDMRSWYLTFGIIFLLAGTYTVIKNESFFCSFFPELCFIAII